MNTGTPASTPGARRYSQRPGPRTPRGRGYAKLITTGLLAAIMLAVTAGAFLYAAPSVKAAVVTLVSNTGKTTRTTEPELTSTTTRFAQLFITGTNTAGYTVDSIGIKLAGISDTSTAGTDLKMELYKSTGSGPESSALCTFTDPGSFTADSVNTFDAPTDTPCPTLAENTAYFAVLERVSVTGTSTIKANTTQVSGEDAGKAAGWSIAFQSFSYSSSSWSSSSTYVYQVEINGELLNNEPTGLVLLTGDPKAGETLTADTSGVMDEDGLGTFSYQWAYSDGVGTLTDISSATSSTYELDADDVGKQIVVKVSYEDGRGTMEGPLLSNSTIPVKPNDIIVKNTAETIRFPLSLTAANPRLAQQFTASATADSHNLEYAAFSFGTIGDTFTVSGEITVTLNGDSSGSPGDVLCTLTNPATFSSSGLHEFHAPIGPACPQLAAGGTYYFVIERANSNTSAISLEINAVQAATDVGSSDGWSVSYDYHQYTDSTSTWAQSTSGVNMIIEVKVRFYELEALTETEVPFDWSLTPEGVASGQKFRLMFLTDPEKPTSDDIDVYNEFVQAQAAAGHADIQEHATQFRVLGSTAAVDARDNTETTSSDTDAPIYWLNGAIVADNYADMYDETWDEEANRRTAAGDPSTDTDFIWTGSDDDGTERSETGGSVALGETSVRQGELDNSSSTRDPLSASTVAAATNTAPFYALSGIFVAEPNNEATTVNPLTVRSNPRVGDAIYTTLPWRISDPDGTTNAVFQLQWLRYDPATETETEIEGATSQPYFVTHADADHQLGFTITFTDDHGNPEKLVSERSERVLPADVLLRMKPGHDQVDASLDSTTSRYAQKFNTGHIAEGYHLESIGFHLSQIDNPATAGQHLEVNIQEPDEDGNPDNTVCVLRDPSSFAAPGIHHFTNPPSVGRCPNLEPSTDYFAVMLRTTNVAADNIKISLTTETDEADGSLQGWSIENAGLRFTNNAWEDSPSSHRTIIEVRGDQAREITIPIDSPLIPDALEGSRFRLLFVTDSTSATGGDILRYQLNLSDSLADANDGTQDTIVVRQLQAQGKSHMRLLASTDDLDARDNTFSTYTSTHKGVPIFWYKGAIVANDYEDLYDGAWQNEDKPRLYDGTLVMDLTKEYWTGSDNDGTAKTRGGVSKALGHSEVETGILNHATGAPLSHAADDPTESKSMYALTGIYIIENLETTGLPVITGAPRVGDTLTADTRAITDGNGTDRATFTYQWWKVNGTFSTPIAGANKKTYTPTADLAGKPIALDVTMKDNHGYKTRFQNFQIDPTEPIQPTDLIVKNTEVGTPTALNASSNSRQAQGFTAASDAEPYSLTEVRISFAAVDDPTAASTEITLTINAQSSGFPGEELCTLSNPSGIAGSGLSTFEAPDSCPPLTPGNTYYVVIARGADASGDIEVNLTGAPGQHEGSAPGWTLDFPLDLFNNGTWVQAVFTNNIVLDIRGEISTELPAPENWPLTPTGLIGGDKFRLLFITYTGHSSANTDIENYNAYVQSQANAGNAHAAIKPYSYWFRVLGSTEDVSARDNTMTTGAGAPIYWMGGDKVADNYGDFYDGSWDSEMSSGRAGIPSSSAYALWTGTENNGTRASANGVYQTLGTASVRIGSLNGSGDPLSSLNTIPGTNYHYYALSGIFIAPNTDATGQPAISGTPRVNETLSVDTSGITDPEGTANADFTYQWIRVDGSVDNDISGATNATYRLTNEDADKQIKVKVSFIDDRDFAEGPLTSEPTSNIAGRNVLVRNTSQTAQNAPSNLTATSPKNGQGLTTGSDPDGYSL